MNKKIAYTADYHQHHAQQHNAGSVCDVQEWTSQQIENHSGKRISADYQSTQPCGNPQSLQIVEEVVEDANVADGQECDHAQPEKLEVE